ncbi:DUF4219 domain-containing protein [Tanacetum coccineum]|uniref:DUF4219 domain-containing protein n=1 Tax=Tanacetum coccineum TaxID=301880 RepID=A0ABQ4XAT8_9ASTR
MDQESYVEGYSMQRPPLLEPNGFCFWKARFETYVKSKDIDLWQVIQNGDFYYEVEDSETKLMKETLYELLEDDQKKKLGKNNEAKMTLYNALPQYEKFSISNEETIDSGFTRFNAIVTSLKSLDPDYSSKNHVRKFLHALPLKMESQAEAFNILARNFRKFSRKGNQFGRRNRFRNNGNRFGKGRSNSFEYKGGESSKKKGACYNCGIEGHFASESRKSKENKAFLGGAWSDSEDGDEDCGG